MGIQSSDEITLGFVVDIKETKAYYKMQSSTADPPSVPTTNPPTGWSVTEPAHTMGAEETLYSTILTVFTDDSFSYSDVSASASFQAAEDAAKIATNYMRFENGKGLVIGDMTDDELGQNTLIDSEGVAIREGEDESARFSKDKVSLLDGAFEFTAGHEEVDMVGNTTLINLIDSNVDGMRLQNGTEGGSGRGESKSTLSISTRHDITRPYLFSDSGIMLSSESKIVDGSEKPTRATAGISLSSMAYPTVNDNPELDSEACDSSAVLWADTVTIKGSRELTLSAAEYYIGNPKAFRRALSSDKYAAITVQYPAGSKCYCENEELGITYEALDEIGSYEFAIPSDQLGVWKITIVNSEKTATRTVTLSEDKRTAHVNMSYWNGELFDSGDQFTDITGGWYRADYKNANESTYAMCDIGTRLYVYGITAHDCAIITLNPVDMTEFTKLVVEYDKSQSTNAAYVGVFRSNVEPLKDQTANVIARLAFSTTKDTITLDITSITGMMYPVIYTVTSGSAHHADVTKMYMLR